MNMLEGVATLDPRKLVRGATGIYKNTDLKEQTEEEKAAEFK
jgi:hypothetical protein